MRRASSLILGLTVLALAGSAAAQPAEPQVSAFSPQGTVKQVRQAQAHFSAPMVPLGDPRLTDPFDVACAESGAGRWVDTSIWVYDFARDLPAGLRCTFTLRVGLQALSGRDGAVLGDAADFILWPPAPGRHRLSVLARDGRILDTVIFVVRGASAAGDDGERAP